MLVNASTAKWLGYSNTIISEVIVQKGSLLRSFGSSKNFYKKHFLLEDDELQKLSPSSLYLTQEETLYVFFRY